MRNSCQLVLLVLCVIICAPAVSLGQEPGETVIRVANDELQMTVPAAWQRKQPAFNIIEHEYVIPGEASPADDGRLTMMSAGGTIEANVERWKGQFEPSADEDHARVEKRQIADCDVHIVDIRGTFKPRRGGANLDDYRMLAAVIVTPTDGRYFVKLTGPEKTVTGSEDSFFELLESMSSN